MVSTTTRPHGQHSPQRVLDHLARPTANASMQQVPCKPAVPIIIGLLLFILLLLQPGPRYLMSAGLTSFVSVSSAHNSTSPISNGRSTGRGWCQLTYTVKTFDGRHASVCEASLCDGHSGLKSLGSSEPTKRWSEADEKAYTDNFSAVGGWLQWPQVQFVKAFTKLQHELGIFGTIAEIGVHYGKFFLPVLGNALVGEPAVAIDLFEDQTANVDGSGYGNKPIFLGNLKRFHLLQNNVTVLAANSMSLTAANFSARGLPAFRLISVDGGHTLEITLHDLMLASCLVRDGGLVVLDDFPHPTWIGVSEALMHFSNAQNRLVPFLHGYNKVWFTTSSHVKQYSEYVAKDTEVFKCGNTIHPSRRAIAGHALCFVGKW